MQLLPHSQGQIQGQIWYSTSVMMSFEGTHCWYPLHKNWYRSKLHKWKKSWRFLLITPLYKLIQLDMESCAYQGFTLLFLLNPFSNRRLSFLILFSIQGEPFRFWQLVLINTNIHNLLVNSVPPEIVAIICLNIDCFLYICRKFNTILFGCLFDAIFDCG